MRRGMHKVMSWEESMFAVFDDLEQQAQGLHLVERDAEVADLTLAEYSRVSLASRLHASLGLDLRVRLLGGRVIGGRLARLGDDWFLLVEGASEWVVRGQGVASIGGLSSRAHSEDTWSVVDRLTMRAVLRRLAMANEPCLVHFCDEQQVEGCIGRVGRDFFELNVGEGAGRVVQAVPHTAVAALQGRR
jgi:hypothetical protein